MNEKVKKFLHTMDENPELKRQFSTKAGNNVDYANMPFDDKIKFIRENVIPFAKQNGFEFGVEDILAENEKNLNEIDEKLLEKVAGGVSSKFSARALAALTMMSLISPAGLKAIEVDTLQELPSVSVSVQDSNQQSQKEYANVLTVLKDSYKKLPQISQNSPMNEVDGLVFALLSYLPMNCVPNLNSDISNEDITLSEFSSRLFEFLKTSDKKMNLHFEDEHNVLKYQKNASRHEKDPHSYISVADNQISLLKLVAQCPRYKNIKIGNFLGKYSDIKNSDYEQFAAVTFTLEDGTKAVAFRGTDSTLTGWKEDLDLSWSDNVLAQQDSLAYLKKIYSNNKDSKFVILGHSKGGNLAIYSSSLLCNENKDFLSNNLTEILNYDGPGLRRDMVKSLSSDVFDETSEKLTTFIPQTSVIGRIMSDTSKGAFVCVHSLAETFMMQHDLFSWNIKTDYCSNSESSNFESYKLQSESDFAADAISLFLSSLDSQGEAMKIFVNWIFNFMNDNDINFNNKDLDFTKIFKSVFYNYFVKGKSPVEVMDAVFAPKKSLSMDDNQEESFKTIMSDAMHAIMTAYWYGHMNLNKKMGISPEVNSSIEKMVDSNYSFGSIANMAKTVVDKATNINSIEKFFKKLYN